MVKKCCVALCSNNGKTPNISLHKFASDPELMEIWMHKIRRDTVKSERNPRPFRVSRSTKICSAHFERSDFLMRSERKILKSTAIPSIFQWTNIVVTSKRNKPSLSCNGQAEAADGAAIAVTETMNDFSKQLPSGNIINTANEDVAANPVLQLRCEHVALSSNATQGSTEQFDTVDLTNPSPASSSVWERENDNRNPDPAVLTRNLEYKELRTLYTDLLIEQQEFVESCKCKNITTSSKATSCDFPLNGGFAYRQFLLERFKDDDAALLYYTGFSNYSVLKASLNILFDYSNSTSTDCHFSSGKNIRDRQHSLSRENQYFLVLIKLRQNFDYHHLSNLFNVPGSTVCRIFTSWINFMYVRLSSTSWAPRDVILSKSTAEFRHNYPNVIGFLDATEIFIQTPSSLLSQTYSRYKRHNTVKGLVVVDCNGSVIFVSALFAGSISDNMLLQRSSFAKVVQSKLRKGFLLPGDTFLADKGFSSTELLKPVEIHIPAFRINNTQFSSSEVFHPQKIAHGRIQKAIGRIKTYKILSAEVPLSFLGTFNQIWTVCCLLSNFQRH